MEKFKVGDKVKYVIVYEGGHSYQRGLRGGEIGVIKENLNSINGLYQVFFSKIDEVIPLEKAEFEFFSRNGSKPKPPKFLVLWEEESDPHKFFETEKEAKEFINTLGNARNIKFIVLGNAKIYDVDFEKIAKYK